VDIKDVLKEDPITHGCVIYCCRFTVSSTEHPHQVKEGDRDRRLAMNCYVHLCIPRNSDRTRLVSAKTKTKRVKILS